MNAAWVMFRVQSLNLYCLVSAKRLYILKQTFKYVLPFSRHQALKGWTERIMTSKSLCFLMNFKFISEIL